ncbi:hypothetical protein CRUP_026516 [Coryphaenoides rupestris]|nr:hypothetical protein CRUP_026516 [Coryphaenoides rupestris]
MLQTNREEVPQMNREEEVQVRREEVQQTNMNREEVQQTNREEVQQTNREEEVQVSREEVQQTNQEEVVQMNREEEMQMSREEVRYKMYLLQSCWETYQSWLFEEGCGYTSEKMAEAGFLHTPPDVATCFLCQKQLEGWVPEDDPAAEHLSHSPKCGFITLKKKVQELSAEEAPECISHLHHTELRVINLKDELKKCKLDTTGIKRVLSERLKRDSSIRRSQQLHSVRLRTSSSFQKTEGATEVKKGQRLIEKEGMETGQVKFSVYLRAMGWSFSALL